MWLIVLHPEVEKWFLALAKSDPSSAERVQDAINMLESQGPTLGRPLVDRIKGSKLHALKEQRPASAGRTKIRILFAFDAERQAVLLVAGDKAGNWTGWYDTNIPIAERRWAEEISGMN